MTPDELRGGQVLHVTAAASVQFIARPIVFRLIRPHPWTTYDEWIWLDGYQLDHTGQATDRRSIFVKPAGLRLLADTRADRQRQLQAYATRNTGPRAVPRPRTPTEPITGRTR